MLGKKGERGRIGSGKSVGPEKSAAEGDNSSFSWDSCRTTEIQMILLAAIEQLGPDQLIQPKCQNFASFDLKNSGILAILVSFLKGWVEKFNVRCACYIRYLSKTSVMMVSNALM